MKNLLLVLIIAVLTLGLFITGCVAASSITSSSAPQSTAAPSASTSVPQTSVTQSVAPSSSTASILTPKYGGTLKVISVPTGLNIGWPADVTFSAQQSQYSMDTLLRQDHKGNVIPWLAESYKIADDMKSITFNLRKGVKFHDGSDFNAEAAKWNLDNYIKAKMESIWASVDILDDYTIRVNITQWSNTVLTSFADATSPVFMVSEAAFDKNGKDWMKQNPVGTGPFKFASYNVDVSYKVVRNPDYWAKDNKGNQLPYLDGVEYTFIADAMTQEMSMKNGEADMLVGLAVGKTAANLASLGLKMDYAMDGLFCLIPDSANTDSPWSNQKVREAVEYAIDREAIAKALGYGFWQAPYQIPPHASAAYDPDFSLGRKYDLAKAKQLLAEAGYPDGFETTIIAATTAQDEVTLTLQADLAKIGIKINLDFPQQAKFISYIGPNATWHNAAIYFSMPIIDSTYSLGLQFLMNFVGKSWQRTPELLQAYQASTASTSIDVNLIRAVTNIITKDASIIPINENGLGRIRQPYVISGYNERRSLTLYNTEQDWLNK